MKKRDLLVGAVLIVSSMLAVSCGKKTEKVAVKNVNAQATFAVDTVRVVRGEISDYIKLTGDVKSKRDVKVFPDQAGKIANIYVVLGQQVRKGQKLIDIDPSRPGMVFSNSPVFAPVSGTVTTLPYKIGETVSSQSAIGSVGRLDDMEVVTYVAEKYISKMRKNLPVSIRVDAYPDMNFKGYIYELSPVVDPTSRMMEAKIDINDPNFMLLKPGMHSDIKIVTDKKLNTVKIPTTTVIRRYGEAFVFVVKETPTELENIIVDKILSEATDEEKALLLNFFPKRLPEEFRVDIFEYKLLKSLDKRIDEQNALKSLYTFNPETEMYVLNESDNFDELHEKVWKIMIEFDAKYMLLNPKGFNSSTKEDEALRQLLIDKKVIDASTKFVEKRVIQPGIEIDNKTEVNSGLLKDEEIVYNGQSLLENNAKIRIVQLLNIEY